MAADLPDEISTLSEPWPKGGKEWAPNAEWTEVSSEECCVWPFKTWLPFVALAASTTGGGTGLEIRVIARHNCGIIFYGLTIRITNIKTGESWVMRINKDINPAADVDDLLIFGSAAKKHLPVSSLDGWHLSITGWATSECTTTKDFTPIDRDIVFI
jgi:hypothetical protein